jgi:hypothetical protein
MRSTSTNTQHLPIFAPGISPVRAFSCSVTGWMCRNAAAAWRSSVFTADSVIVAGTRYELLTPQVDGGDLLAAVAHLMTDRLAGLAVDRFLLWRELL